MCNSLSESWMSVSDVFTCLYVISRRDETFSGKYMKSNLNTNILRKTYFRVKKVVLFKKINSFISWNIHWTTSFYEFLRTKAILRNVFLKSAFIWQNNAFPYIIPYKFLHVYSRESCTCGCKSVRQEIPRVAHLCILNDRVGQLRFVIFIINLPGTRGI